MSKFRRPQQLAELVLFAGLAGGSLFVLTTLFADEFRVTSVHIKINDVLIDWNGPGGSNYVVQSATSSAGGWFNTNFIDLSPVIFLPGTGMQSTNFTHTGGVAGTSSRFYRVRSFSPPPTLQSLLVYPTNAIIGVGMTNRYKVLAVYSNNTTNDVTTNAMLTVQGNAAQLTAVINGFAFVRGNSAGNGSLLAVYQGLTNSASVTVSQLVGLFTVPSLTQIKDYVAGASTSVQVMGIFANGKTNNITVACNLEGAFGGGPVGTRVDYNVRADVANSFALITGQSAASEDIVFTAGDLSSDPISVTWCKYVSVTLLPINAQVGIGASQQYQVVGLVADGTMVNVPSIEVTDFNSSDSNIAQADASTLQVSAIAIGTVSVVVSVNNGAGCSDILDSQTFTVVPLPAFATTQSPTSIRSNTAALNGMATPNGSPSTAWFEWGQDLAYGQTTSPVVIGAGKDVVVVRAGISGLNLGAVYHARLVVSNAADVVYGFDQAFTTAGSVTAWGYNNGGQINVPSDLTNAVAVGGGDVFSLALRNDGRVVAWGDNVVNQTDVPATLSNAVAISAGSFHSLALRNDGRVVGWGRNNVGQTNVPSTLNGVVAVAAGVYHSLALRSNGTVVAWGDNSTWQTNVPSDLSNIVAIADGSWFHSLALRNDGTVVVWGTNSLGQTNVPAGLSNVVAIAAGYNHNLALRKDGSVVSWGDNGLGQTDVPVGLRQIVAIAAGAYHSLALRSDGKLFGWGWDANGQATALSGLSSVVAIAAGYAHNSVVHTP